MVDVQVHVVRGGEEDPAFVGGRCAELEELLHEVPRHHLVAAGDEEEDGLLDIADELARRPALSHEEAERLVVPEERLERRKDAARHVRHRREGVLQNHCFDKIRVCNRERNSHCATERAPKYENALRVHDIAARLQIVERRLCVEHDPSLVCTPLALAVATVREDEDVAAHVTQDSRNVCEAVGNVARVAHEEEHRRSRFRVPVVRYFAQPCVHPHTIR
mmetsp:Transcript_30107/g.97986  ORF Transcript_30107/g.97986 Transcript_30107/m.97986 type:complete len:220 (+) Transcript_30107:134-793(+)